MSAPWLVAGMVHDTAEYMCRQVNGDATLVYMSAFSMVDSLTDWGEMTDAERLERIRDVVRAANEALDRIRDDRVHRKAMSL